MGHLGVNSSSFCVSYILRWCNIFLVTNFWASMVQIFWKGGGFRGCGMRNVSQPSTLLSKIMLHVNREWKNVAHGWQPGNSESLKSICRLDLFMSVLIHWPVVSALCVFFSDLLFFSFDVSKIYIFLTFGRPLDCRKFWNCLVTW